jgi:DNA-binding transcriptional LysR family regulator
MVQIATTMKLPTSLATLPNLESFVAAVENHSFSRAAQQLGVTPQAASRAVARLEQSLGVTLFRRTTRKLDLTDDGLVYYQTCKETLRVLHDAEHRLRDRAQQTAGLVRISVPTTYGHHRLLPALAEFVDRHPTVKLDIHLSNRTIDFVKDGYDMAIRMGDIQDASFNMVRLGQFSVGVFASPEYIRRRTTPITPSDLQNVAHTCIVFLMPKTSRPLPWSLADSVGGPQKSFAPLSSVTVSEDVLGTLTLAAAGVGLAQLYHFVAAPQLQRGELVEVLGDYGGLTRPFSLIYPRNVVQSKPVRALINFLRSNAIATRVEPAGHSKRR